VDDRGVMIQLATGEGNFSLLHNVHAFSGTHPTSHSVGTVIISPGIRGQEREGDLTPPSGSSMELHHFAVCHVLLQVVSN
jgi:hypothetical protein